MRRLALASLALAVTAGVASCSILLPQKSETSTPPSAPPSSATRAPSSPAGQASTPATRLPTGVPTMPGSIGKATAQVTVDGKEIDLTGAESVCTKRDGKVSIIAGNKTSLGGGETSLVVSFTETTVESFMLTAAKQSVIGSKDLRVAKSGATWSITGKAMDLSNVTKPIEVKATFTCDAA